MINSKALISFVVGLCGLGYIAIVTFLRDDAHYLIKLNIIVPFLVITLSLSFITFGFRQVFKTIGQAILLLITNKIPDNSQFDTVLNTMAKYAFTASIIWLLYSAVYVSALSEYSIRSFISFCIVSILYAFLFKSIFVDVSINKHNYLSNKENKS